MNNWPIKLILIVNKQINFFKENYNKDYVRYYVKNVYTDGPREDGVRFPVPVRGRPDFKDVDHYRYFHVKKETFLWEEDERYENWTADT